MYSKIIARSLFAVLACLTLMPSCKKDNKQPPATPAAPAEPEVTLSDQEILDQVLTLPPTAFNYANIALPPYLNTVGMKGFDNTPAHNPTTNEGATLGRVLFYDKLLSANQTTACASCHKQENGFADPVQFSTGFANGKTRRNAMSLANAKYSQHGTLFWDERAATLEAQVLMPIQDQVEMGLSLDELEERLAQQDYYKILFKRAFGDTVISSDRVSLALAQFVRSMVSCQSRFDEGKSGPPGQGGTFLNFTEQENKGKRIFESSCGRCHSTPLHLSPEAQNNGLDMVYADNGLGEVTKRPEDDGKFRAPSLRNIAVTAPYMHDGRFATLAEVVEHYNTEVVNHPNLDKSMKDPLPSGQPRRLNMSQQEQDDLVAFLHTLTDNQFLTDVKYSDPFKK